MSFVVNLQGVSKKRCKQNAAGAAVHEKIGPTEFNFGLDFCDTSSLCEQLFLDIPYHLITATD